MIVRPRPIAETGDTVTYRRTDVDRLFDQLEDPRGARGLHRDAR